MSYDPNGKLEEYKAKVAEEVTRSWQRSRLVNKLTEEAQVAHKTGRYEVSLDKFLYLLAVVELDPKTGTGPNETRATLTSNIGSALHFLGELELAKVRRARSPLAHHLIALCLRPLTPPAERPLSPCRPRRTTTRRRSPSLRRPRSAG